jgi:hypothetical protein
MDLLMEVPNIQYIPNTKLKTTLNYGGSKMLERKKMKKKRKKI